MQLLESFAKQVTVIAKQDVLHSNKNLTLFMISDVKVTQDFFISKASSLCSLCCCSCLKVSSSFHSPVVLILKMHKTKMSKQTKI